jgi:exonuclease VII large subunit
MNQFNDQDSKSTQAALEPLVAHVEQRLEALAGSLRQREILAIEQQGCDLHQALAAAVESFIHAARHGGVPDTLRLRLTRASAQPARQREALARATAALDRAVDVLLPGCLPAARMYSDKGLTPPTSRRDSLSA